MAVVGWLRPLSFLSLSQILLFYCDDDDDFGICCCCCDVSDNDDDDNVVLRVCVLVCFVWFYDFCFFLGDLTSVIRKQYDRPANCATSPRESEFTLFAIFNSSYDFYRFTKIPCVVLPIFIGLKCEKNSYSQRKCQLIFAFYLPRIPDCFCKCVWVYVRVWAEKKNITQKKALSLVVFVFWCCCYSHWW